MSFTSPSSSATLAAPFLSFHFRSFLSSIPFLPLVSSASPPAPQSLSSCPSPRPQVLPPSPVLPSVPPQGPCPSCQLSLLLRSPPLQLSSLLPSSHQQPLVPWVPPC